MKYTKNIISSLGVDNELARELELAKDDYEFFQIIKRCNQVSKEDFVSAFEDYYSVKFTELEDVDNILDIFTDKEVDFLKSVSILPFKLEGDVCYIAASGFLDRKVNNKLSDILQRKGYENKVFFSFKEIIRRAMLKMSSVQSTPDNTAGSGLIDKRLTPKDWVESILNHGLELKSSDVHIEVVEEGVQLRYRVNGALTHKSFYVLNEEEIASLTVRLKVISGLDISEKRKPQDGRIEAYKYKGREYDFRVSTVKLLYGEKIVLRIIDKNEGFLSYEDIGFSKRQKEVLMEMLNKNNGIIYLGGSTGSGKTTTLYSMINTVNTDDINIYSVEDPVEAKINNVNQIQLDEVAGVTYPSTLKALLRQDPDVIVIGEIRDTETAELSVRASLTGHLVLSTLHSNTALDTIKRLIDMGVEPYLVAASSVGFISQRLVRVLCPRCKEKAELTTFQKEWIKNIDEEFDFNGDFYISSGCSDCKDTGYIGRKAVVELLLIDDDIKDALSSSISTRELKMLAKGKGFTTMEENSTKLLKQGIVSIDEIMSKFS